MLISTKIHKYEIKFLFQKFFEKLPEVLSTMEESIK